MQKEYRQIKFKDTQTEDRQSGPVTERVKTFGVKWTTLYVTFPALVAPLVTISALLFAGWRRDMNASGF